MNSMTLNCSSLLELIFLLLSPPPFFLPKYTENNIGPKTNLIGEEILCRISFKNEILIILRVLSMNLYIINFCR